MNEQIEMWREPRVVTVSGLGRSTVWSFIKAGKFPAPVKIGERAIAWPSTAVLAWVRERIAEAGQKKVA